MLSEYAESPDSLKGEEELKKFIRESLHKILPKKEDVLPELRLAKHRNDLLIDKHSRNI